MEAVSIILGAALILFAMALVASPRLAAGTYKKYTWESVRQCTRITLLGMTIFGGTMIAEGLGMAIPVATILSMKAIGVFILCVGASRLHMKQQLAF